jgi:NAD(P)-dependent dehydrogenase (short-subunit alcohol dehydrogenase family)
VRTNAIVGRIISAGGQAMPIAGDLATDGGAAAVYSDAKKAFGGIDILINNAGAYEARPWFAWAMRRLCASICAAACRLASFRCACRSMHAGWHGVAGATSHARGASISPRRHYDMSPFGDSNEP